VTNKIRTWLAIVAPSIAAGRRDRRLPRVLRRGYDQYCTSAVTTLGVGRLPVDDPHAPVAAAGTPTWAATTANR
jgi:hypothetical protein